MWHRGRGRLISATFVRWYRRRFLNKQGQPLPGQEVKARFLMLAISDLQAGIEQDSVVHWIWNKLRIDLVREYQLYLAGIAAKKAGC
jgi:hypothetical protein